MTSDTLNTNNSTSRICRVEKKKEWLVGGWAMAMGGLEWYVELYLDFGLKVSGREF